MAELMAFASWRRPTEGIDTRREQLLARDGLGHPPDRSNRAHRAHYPTAGDRFPPLRLEKALRIYGQ